MFFKKILKLIRKDRVSHDRLVELKEGRMGRESGRDLDTRESGSEKQLLLRELDSTRYEAAEE